jgi:putative salt-induced outer membrane protein YdiY
MLAVLVTLLSSASYAEESEFVGTEAPPAEEKEAPESKLSAELGTAFATGNAIFYTVNGTINASHEWQRNKLGIVGGINLGAAKADTDGDGLLSAAERSADYAQNVKRYYGDARYDRFLTDSDSLYVLAGAFHDPFAGYDLRSHEQIGYSRRLLKNSATELVAELGFDYAQENYTDEAIAAGSEPYQDVFAARVMLGLQHKFNDNVSLSDTLEVYENVIDTDDLRILNTAALTAGLSGKLSLKLSHNLIFDNVPVQGFVKLDQTTMATLVASIL